MSTIKYLDKSLHGYFRHWLEYGTFWLIVAVKKAADGNTILVVPDDIMEGILDHASGGMVANITNGYVRVPTKQMMLFKDTWVMSEVELPKEVVQALK